jgi:voltage-gated potassium channel
MLIGWGTLAVPTGIVTAEMAAHRGGMHEESYDATTRTCHECLSEGHLPEAIYCLKCGAKLPNYLHD